MGGIVVNKTTMNLVSGHQRLKCLDQLEKKKDYILRVEIVEMTEKEEKEQNIFMNSTTVQGEFDLDILAEMLPDINYKNAGLDDYDIQIIHSDGFAIDNDSPELNEIAQQLRQQEKDKIKQLRKDIKNRPVEEIEDETIIMISFNTFTAKVKFLAKLGLDEDERFLKGELFEKRIKVISKY